MARLGTLSLQGMGEKDIFFQSDVFMDGEREIGEQQIQAIPEDFDAHLQYVSGELPGFHPAEQEAESSIVIARFKGDDFPGPFRIRIYLAYEEVEEILDQKQQR